MIPLAAVAAAPFIFCLPLLSLLPRQPRWEDIALLYLTVLFITKLLFS